MALNKISKNSSKTRTNLWLCKLCVNLEDLGFIAMQYFFLHSCIVVTSEADTAISTTLSEFKLCFVASYAFAKLHVINPNVYRDSPMLSKRSILRLLVGVIS